MQSPFCSKEASAAAEHDAQGRKNTRKNNPTSLEIC